MQPFADNCCRTTICHTTEGLEFFTPETKGWRQAHMQARYVILRVLLEAGGGLVTLTETVGADGNPDLEVALDRSLISTLGTVLFPSSGQSP
jgi:hypothetical protein